MPAGPIRFYFRVAITPNGDRSRLTLARVIPDYGADALPDFRDAESSVLAEDIAEVRFGYFGRDPDANDANNDQAEDARRNGATRVLRWQAAGRA